MKEKLMGLFIGIVIICLTVVLFSSLITRLRVPSVTLDGNDWQCADTIPNGLFADCTNYIRKPKQAIRG